MDLEQKSIERIKTASEMSLKYYGQPLVCTYSGGKDSDVMLDEYVRMVDESNKEAVSQLRAILEEV